MKKCPTCEKTFEDSMRFCQVDGTPLLAETPTFDPYATIVARPIATGKEPSAEPAAVRTEPAVDPEIHYTVGSIPIAEPEDVLDLPNDPLKTMYVSDAEMQVALGKDEAADIIEIPPIEEVSQPEPPSFLAPETPVSVASPPPSPFATDSTPDEMATPVFHMPEPVSPTFDEPLVASTFDEPAVFPQPGSTEFEEAATMMQPSFQSPFDTPPAPVAEWTPPPAPAASWQDQGIGSNTPFQPPPVGAGGQNKTLAIVSLVCGILSFLCCSSLFVVGLAAIITGFMARGKANSDPNEFGGGGLALAGIILGALSLIIGVVYWILVLTGAISIPNF